MLTPEEKRLRHREYNRRYEERNPNRRRKPTPTCEACSRDLDQKQWAYLAGIFDGEGSVHLAPSNNRQGRTRTFQLCVSPVCGTNQAAIESIRLMIGTHGHLARHGQRLQPINGKGSRRQAWRLRMYGKHAAWFLRGVMPYLLMKLPQAELGLEHQAGKLFQGHQCSDERAEKEAAAKAAITEMNRRGVQCAL